MATLPLQKSYSVTLTGGGRGTVVGVGPTRYGETWHIRLISVNTTVPCTFSVHRGNDTSAQYQIDATARGELDTSNTDIALQTGETISFKWAGGKNNATGTVRIEGTINLRGY